MASSVVVSSLRPWNLFVLAMWICSVVSLTNAAAISSKKRSLSSTTCESIECPTYTVVYQADDFSIRLYSGAVWMATTAIADTSLTNATTTGFLRLFQYIQGGNEEGVTVNMTAPVLTGVVPSDGPFCENTFYVRFYVPAVNQQDPPTPLSSLNLQVERWDSDVLFGVRQFSGFATDSNIPVQAVALEESLYQAGYTTTTTPVLGEQYLVAQYNSPFDIIDRLNEIWITIDSSDRARGRM